MDGYMCGRVSLCALFTVFSSARGFFSPGPYDSTTLLLWRERYRYIYRKSHTFFSFLSQTRLFIQASEIFIQSFTVWKESRRRCYACLRSRLVAV